MFSEIEIVGKSDFEIPIFIFDDGNFLSKFLNGRDFVGDHFVLCHEGGIGLED